MKQTDRDCGYHSAHKFLLLDLFSQLLTVILLPRGTMLITIAILAVSVIESLRKKIVIVVRI